MNPNRITDIEFHTEATIVDITAEPAIRERLLEMGLSPGRSLRVLRHLPMGGPWVVLVGSLFLALRGEEAEQVWVK